MFASPTTRGDHRYWPELHFQDLLRGSALLGDRLGLLAGSCAGFRTQLILDRSLPDPAKIEVLRSLLDAAAGVAADRGLAYVFFLFLDASARKDLSDAACGRAHSRLAGAAQTELELPGTDFDGYLASLKKNVRTSVRRETALYRESCSTEIIPLREAIPAVAPMVADVRAKHGMAHSVDAVSRRLRAYHSALGDDLSKAVVCRAKGRIVGAGVLCRWNDRLYVTDFGRRDGDTRDPFVYFNTTIYEPIKYAYAVGLSRVVMGAGAELAKAQRGSAMLPLTHLALAVGSHADLLAADTSRAADLRDHWRTQRGAHPRHFGPVWDEFL
jgi:predicted N-acyltransferase